MDTLENVTILERAEPVTKTSKKSKKRKWREIEVLKDKYLLRKELQDLDWSLDMALEDIHL